MNPKTWFLSQKFWLRGGIIGAVACIALFVFYICLLFPLAQKLYPDHEDEPGWLTSVPVLTGHMFVFFSYPLAPTDLMCKATEPYCTDWVPEALVHGEPSSSFVPMVQEGEAGYCTNYALAPTNACGEQAENVGFLIAAGLLVLIYFGLGAAVGYSMQKGNFRIY